LTPHTIPTYIHASLSSSSSPSSQDHFRSRFHKWARTWDIWPFELGLFK
jgi:hypothetical protein